MPETNGNHTDCLTSLISIMSITETILPPPNDDLTGEYTQDTDDPLKSEYLQATTEIIAQTLFDYYQQYSFNIDEWIACLHAAIGEKGPFLAIQIKTDIEKILTNQRQIRLSEMSEDAQNELIREVSEWLVAQKFAERMFAYEDDVMEKIESGEYKKLKVDEVVLRSDDQVYDEDICRFIEDNYVVDKNSFRTVGAGARITAYNLIPMSFPMPVPKEDELGRGLMLKIPNTELVLRETNEVYRRLTRQSPGQNQLPQIESLRTAIEGRIFDLGIIEQDENDLLIRQKIVHRVDGEPIFSFIPPFVILKVTIDGEKEPDYVTVQKKIQTKHPDQCISPQNPHFLQDLESNPRLRIKVEQFISACKDFYIREKKLPDLRGRGNILYTEKGNVYLVDINNISDEPDYTATAYLHLLGSLQRQEYCAKTPEDKQKIAEDILTLVAESEPVFKKYGLQEPEQIKKLAYNTNYYDENKAVRELFARIGIFDEIQYPIFWQNTKILFELEKILFQIAEKDGEISQDEHKQKLGQLANQPIYRILKPHRVPVGTNVYAQGIYGYSNPIMQLRKDGDHSWITAAAHELLAFIENVEKGRNELYEA